MKKITLLTPAAAALKRPLFWVLTVFLLPTPYSLLPAVSQKPQLTPQTKAPAPVSLEDRRKALNDIFHEYWEDRLKHDPEFASSLGDKRYNDQTSDYSVQAVNDALAREQRFLHAPGGHRPHRVHRPGKDQPGLAHPRFEMDEEGAEFKEWEMPVDQMGGIYSDYPRLAAELSFTTVKDYDDWIARLHALPAAFAQVTENMSIGMEDGRVPPKYLLEKRSTR